MWRNNLGNECLSRFFVVFFGDNITQWSLCECFALSFQEECVFLVIWSNSTQFNFVSILSNILLILDLYLLTKILFKTYFCGIALKQTNIPLPCTVDQLVIILVTFCIRSSIFWALKLIFLILASEDPECAPCPIAWDYTVSDTYNRGCGGSSFSGTRNGSIRSISTNRLCRGSSPKLYYWNQTFLVCYLLMGAAFLRPRFMQCLVFVKV